MKFKGAASHRGKSTSWEQKGTEETEGRELISIPLVYSLYALGRCSPLLQVCALLKIRYPTTLVGLLVPGFGPGSRGSFPVLM